MPTAGSTLSPLAHRLFLILLMSALCVNFGHAVHTVGAAWLVTSLDGRADRVALVQTAISLPVMLFALIGGAVADMYDRRRVMLVVNVAGAAIALLLALLSYQGMVSPWMVIAFTFAIGTCFAFHNPTLLASIGSVVPRGELPGAASLNILGFNIARTVGPALGGAVVAFGGAFSAFVFNALGALAAAALLLVWRPPPREPAAREGRVRIAAAIGEGLRSVRDNVQLRGVILRTFCFTLCGSAAWALMPLVVRDLTGGGPEQFGLLLGALGLGAVLGGAASHEIRRRASSETLVRLAGAVYGVGCIVVAMRPGFAATFLVLTIGGAAWVQALSGFAVTCQIWAPRALVGRVMATNSTMLFGGLALGSWAWGLIAESFGVAAALTGSGAAMLLVGALGLLLPMPRNEDAPAQ